MQTTLTTTHQIFKAQLSEIEALMDNCRKTDGNVVPIYPHLLTTYRNTPCNVLCYQGARLIGFLSVFFFYEEACEIAVMVAPEHRRSGVALKMLAEVLPILHGFQMQTLYFSSPSGQNREWFCEHAFRYHSSEYQMQRQSEDAPVIDDKQSLSIRKAQEADVSILCALDAACFKNQTKNASERFHRLILDSNYSLYIATQNDVPIGKAHLCWQEQAARLTDVAIIPRLQGQGLGRIVLAHCINEALAKKKYCIRLDVETVNQRALHLYTRLGFETVNAYDYWTTSIKNKMLQC